MFYRTFIYSLLCARGFAQRSQSALRKGFAQSFAQGLCTDPFGGSTLKFSFCGTLAGRMVGSDFIILLELAGSIHVMPVLPNHYLLVLPVPSTLGLRTIRALSTCLLPDPARSCAQRLPKPQHQWFPKVYHTFWPR